MRPDSERVLTLIITALAAVCLAGAAAAQTPTADPEADFRLQPSLTDCGEEWLSEAAQLTDEQREWLLRREHRLYTLRAAGQVVATVELLSTASLRDCSVAESWAARETTVRVVYFEPDGSQRVELLRADADEIFFDRPPTFYPMLGKAMLRGVTRDGRELGRWLPLAGLPAVVDALRDPAPRARLAFADARTAALVAAAAVAMPAGGM